MHLTQSEEMLIQKSCDQSWSRAECKLVQSRILAAKTDLYGRKHRTLQKEWGFDLQESASRRLVSAELCRSSPDSVAVHPPDVSCRSGASPTSQQKACNMCKPLVSHLYRVILEPLRKKKLCSPAAPWPVWTLNPASVREVQAVRQLGVMKSRISENKSEVMGETVLRKSRFVFVPSLVVEQNVKREPEMDRAELPITEPLKQLTDLMREVQQQDVCDMEVNLIEVMRQELETLVEFFSAEEDDVEDRNVRW